MGVKVLGRPEVELPVHWWLTRTDVEKRVGWRDTFGIYWFVVCFLDGTRGPVTYGTNNGPVRRERG